MYKGETLQLLIHPFYASSGHLWQICEDLDLLRSVFALEEGAFVIFLPCTTDKVGEYVKSGDRESGGDLKALALSGSVYGALWQSGVLCGNVKVFGTCDSFVGAVLINEPGGKRDMDDFEHTVFFASGSRLLPDFYGVFLLDRKPFFYGKSRLHDPESGKPGMGWFCGKRFA